jgi:hypothetical protein
VLFIDVKMYDAMFQHNMYDWCLGGPKVGGWSRSGPPIHLNKVVRLNHMKRAVICVNDGLAKNESEVESWHISFLKGDQTAYRRDYLGPRYNLHDGEKKCQRFLSLFESIKLEGFNKQHPVYVADVGFLNLGFRYFRFDGCHRLSCSKVLGITEVPAFVFTLKEVR